MKKFLDKNFLLENPTAERLYHDYASPMPIIDYHCHLNPQQIAEDVNFSNLTQIWLAGDHYKWRAMRANGVDEKFITGDASDRDKFLKWAETVPDTLRNPLYHWTHLELQRYFGSLGYTEVTKNISVDTGYIDLSIVLPPQTYMIPEVRISASGEDPAYWIMRKTIGLANYHLNEVLSYQAEIYIKGAAIMKKIPKAIAKRIDAEGVRNSLGPF